MKRLVVLLSSLMLISAVCAIAQEQTGSIFGTVKNQEGAVIPGAKIVAKSPSLIRPLETTTNDKGVYVFPALPVGTYSINFSADKYKSAVQKALPLTIGAQLRVNATLEVGVVGEEVITITGETPLIDVKSTDTGMSISKELFAVLPKGRNFTSVVTLAPGANDENVGGGIQIDGSSSSENVWVVDGIDVTDFYDGTTTQTAAFEFVEEVQIRSGGYEAEFGGSMGGVVNVVTRSGGNEFHGEGTFYINNSKLDGDARASLRQNPLDYTIAEYVTWPKDSYSRYEFGGGIGGYLQKDRIWFFTSYLPYFKSTERLVNWRDSDDNITGSETFTRDETVHQFSGKLSAQVTNSLRVSGSYMTDWQKFDGKFPAKDGHSNPAMTWAEMVDKYPGYSIAASMDYLVTDSLYANFKGGYRYTDHIAPKGPPGVRHLHDGKGMFIYSDDPAYAGVPEDYRVPRFWAEYGWGDGFVYKKDIREKQNWSGDLTHFAELKGSHMVKGGLQYFRIAQNVDQMYAFDYIRIYWGTECPVAWEGSPTSGKYGYYQVRSGHKDGYGYIADVSSARYALFLQDSWTPTSKMTINFGIRSEKEDIPSFSDLPEFQYPPIKFGFADKIAPRFGIAYDLWGNGKLKLFGNYALYQDVMKLAMALGSYGGMKWQTHYMTLDTLEWWNIGMENPKGTWPRGDMSAYPGIEIGHRDWRIPSFDTTDPDMKPYAIAEYIAGADYQLAENMALNLRFVHKRLRYAIEDVGVQTDEGEQYYICNPGYGYSISKAVPGAPPHQKALRHYWALETRLTKRFSNNWQAGGNLTLSRLTGNMSGLASSDEFGRQDPNVERYFDSFLLSYDANWNPIDGVLPTDRRYTLKLFGSYHTDFGLTVGGYQTIQDGTPLSTAFTINNLQGWYPYNRGDLGRTKTFYQTDLYAEYNFKIGEHMAQVNLNVINLFDQKIPYRVSNYISYHTVYWSDDELVEMYEDGTPIPWSTEGMEDNENPLFGWENTYQSARQIRVGFKVFF